MTSSIAEKKMIIDWIDANHKAFDDLALEIWKKPEIAFEEKFAARLQMDFLKERGFNIVHKPDGPATAFMAEWGTGGPVIGLLGEYDALAGLSQTVSAAKEATEAGAPGHGCGHNLLGAGCLMAAVAVKEVLAAKNIKGTVRYYGCPAEEQLVGKSVMAKSGYFEGTDVSISWHPADFSYVTDCTMTAMVSAKFQFTGRTAHAGASPEAGRSALDAVELMNVGANYLREHIPDDARVHYTITNAGGAPNIVPAFAESWYYVRAPHRKDVAEITERLVDIARGAALMTGTTMDYEIISGCYEYLTNDVMFDLTHKNMEEVPLPVYTEEEMKLARDL